MRLEYVKDVSFDKTILFSETSIPLGNLSQNFQNIAKKLNVIKYLIEKSNNIKDLIISFLNSRENANRKEIDDIVINKLSDSLTKKQKR